jgi:hypothetical protein
MNNESKKHEDTVKRGKNRSEDREKRSNRREAKNVLRNWEIMDDDDTPDLE